MTNAKQASQLISKSLRQTIDKRESTELERQMNSDEQTQKFAQLSKAIQDSVSIAAEEISGGTSSDAPQLSEASKQRMRDSIQLAADEQSKLSQSGLITSTRDARAERARQTTAQPVSPELGGGEPSPDADTRRVTSRFRLLRPLGEGGLGTVWLARDEKLNRNVALKELHRDALESEKAWRRFQREAEITGMLEHPNIVPIYQFGDDHATGEPFYAMRFVGKRTLADAIAEYHDRVEAGEGDQIELHRLLSVFLDICQAIAYAHSRGVIHRDLKPENVALDNFCQVVILDWGLAKLIDDGELAHKLSLSDSDSLYGLSKGRTLQGDIVGTPSYMAPEQAEGDPVQIDEATDVYGLGAVLFAILTGTAPHAESIAEGTDNLRDAIKSIAQNATPSARSKRPCVPLALDRICAKAMNQKRHLRYKSVEQLSEAVERWMAGQSDKQANYEAMRMEGRELRADLQNAVNDLERNVRFMTKLPSIQLLIAAETEEDIAIWRERLATIFRGLLEANPDYTSVAYMRVKDQEFSELVRVERHGDGTSIRVVPKSRLRNTKTNEFIDKVVAQKPEDGITSLVCDPLCEKEEGCPDDIGLASAVPVYDEKTEESYGLVMIDFNINQVLRRQLNRRFASLDVIASCDIFHVMMRSKDGQIMDESMGRPVREEAPEFSVALEQLGNRLEFIDEDNASVYAAKLWFIPGEHGLVYLLRR